METILIAGVDSVAGANLAASLADRFRVVGLSLSSPVAIAGCDSGTCRSDDPDSVRGWVASARPHRVVYCGPSAHSTWPNQDVLASQPNAVNDARNWARAANEGHARLTLLSTDAIFTGPWMFHREESDGLCQSRSALLARKIEDDVWQLCPDALIVRTQAFGWLPDAVGYGWIERALIELERGNAGPFDYLRHSTPILASDLADILAKAWDAELDGIYHITGAERANPGRFVERLAIEFGLPMPRQPEPESLSELPAGFGRGEASLHTGKIRKALGIAMPTLGEGLERLRQQSLDGYRNRLNADSPVHERVA